VFVHNKAGTVGLWLYKEEDAAALCNAIRA
jgi:hypothetical protein